MLGDYLVAAILQESDLFMDALTASATTKKEPKKRKRRPSVSKDIPSSPTCSPGGDQSHPSTPTSPQTSSGNNNNAAPGSPSLGLKNIAPINFYQDTLSTEETMENAENDNKENTSDNANENEANTEIDTEENKDPSSGAATPTDDNNDEEPSSPKKPRLEGGLKEESSLVDIRYFELDETERVNVTKTFGDMAKMEMSSEREAIQMSRKIVGEDTMQPQIMWKLPFIIEQSDPLAIPGHKSLEKDIQFAREKATLPALYFDKRRIPDSPEEPIPENHQMSDPIVIPLEDPESQEIDLRSTPWPEPKGSPPHIEPPMPPHIFHNIPANFTPPFNNIPPPQFQGMPPRFQGPVGPVPIPPVNFIPPNMMPNGNLMGPPNMGPPTDMMNQGPMNPNMYPPGPGPDNFGPVPDAFGPGPDYPMFGNQNPAPNMYPPNNFNNHRQGNRGYHRGSGNSGNWVRMSGPGNWKRGGGHRGRLCKNFQNRGFCRNGDNCQFVHQ
ncbi:hypothetical protein NQ317_005889 [Molorchus minor]|uniref:C3H1-type domain-containing protein n=1 Tax=Molorchus minor TaxID=1323400 RepID=A0ABQ9K0M5_9CUCU|nr:hypothetical protein NQ317_005889 [Molorchus minor]